MVKQIRPDRHDYSVSIHIERLDNLFSLCISACKSLRALRHLHHTRRRCDPRQISIEQDTAKKFIDKTNGFTSKDPLDPEGEHKCVIQIKSNKKMQVQS